MKKICVFCGSSTGKDPLYSEFTSKLADYLAENSVSLVYGGGDVGLMGILSSTMMKAGAHVTGIIPEMIHSHVPHSRISELVVVKTMHERKALMYRMADAFICIPGGIGSLEELLEVFTWQQLGYHSKPVCVINIKGFYSNLLRQMEFMVDEGFLKKAHMSNLIVKEDLNNLLEELFSAEIHHDSKWNGNE